MKLILKIFNIFNGLVTTAIIVFIALWLSGIVSNYDVYIEMPWFNYVEIDIYDESGNILDTIKQIDKNNDGVGDYIEK